MEMVKNGQVGQLINDVPREVGRNVQHELDSRLRRYLFHAAQPVGCEFHEGVVVLRGRVGSFHEKQMAQELARKVDGVKIVVNRLVVDSFAASKVASEVLLTGRSLEPWAIPVD